MYLIKVMIYIQEHLRVIINNILIIILELKHFFLNK